MIGFKTNKKKHKYSKLRRRPPQLGQDTYKKDNDTLTYINTSSNQPPSIIKHIPKSIGRRLSDNFIRHRLFQR